MSTDARADARAAEAPGLFEATSVVGGMTLLSRITGLARDMALSTWFGSGPVMDAFAVAFKIPNLLRRFFAEGAFAQAFVPVMSETRVHKGALATRDLAANVAGTLGVALLGVTLVGVIAAPITVLVFAPGFARADGRFDLAVDMLRFTFPYILFVSLTALCGGLLNSNGRFAVTAFTPVLLNVVLILFGGLVDPHLGRPGIGLAMGVLAAGVVQLAFQLPALRRLGLLSRPRWAPRHPDVRRIFRLMVPALFGSSVAQLSILLDTVIASFLAAGSISWLYYADRLVEFPLGVFGIAIATAILPRLAEDHARAQADRFSATLDWALKLVCVIGVPAAVGLAWLAEPLMLTLFYRGEFTLADVAMSAASLRAYAPGLIGFILVKVLAPGYFARQDVRSPVRFGVYALLSGIALSLMFVLTLLWTSWAPAHAGIAAATSSSALINAGLLLFGLSRAGIYRSGDGWRVLMLRVAVASVAMAFALDIVLTRLGGWASISGWARAGWLLAHVLMGGAVYFAVAYGCGLRMSQLRLKTTA